MDPLRSASRMTGGHDSVKNNWILRANALWMTTMNTRFYALLRMTKKRRCRKCGIIIEKKNKYYLKQITSR